MSQYQYQVKQLGGRKIDKGRLEAESSTEAIRRLKSQGLIVLAIKPVVSSKFHLPGKFTLKRVNLNEKIIFTRQLGVMIKAGLSVVRGLESLRKQSENSYFQQILDEMIKAVRGGQPLSKALIRHPRVFSEIYVSVIRAGEQTGQLAEVLMTLAEQQEKEAELISKIKGAMIYPAVILIALVGVIILVVFMVIPSLQAVFADIGGRLPLQTRILLGSSQFLQRYFLLILPILAGAIFLLHLYFRASGQGVYDRLKITIPVFGGLTKRVYMARFSRTLAMLIKASLPILESLEIVKKTIANSLYAAAFNRISKAVEAGRPVSKAFEAEPLFPPMVSQLTALGEQSGNLDSVLMEVATFYDKEVDNISRNLTTLLEPMLLILMGLGVAFVATAVLGPIYNLVESF